jgi:hypothetical protein
LGDPGGREDPHLLSANIVVMQMMTRDQAQQAALARWRELPKPNQTILNAVEFAKLLAPTLEFHTIANREKVIAAWLVQDVERRSDKQGWSTAPS